MASREGLLRNPSVLVVDGEVRTEKRTVLGVGYLGINMSLRMEGDGQEFFRQSLPP